MFAKQAQRLIESASGVCLVLAPAGDERTDVIVGQAMQRAWLALTNLGMAAQPMMSLPVLDNALANGSPSLIKSLEQSSTGAILRDFRNWAAEFGPKRVAFLLRFGYALPPTTRTGRRPLATCMELSTEVQGGGVSSRQL
jgi:hypothetical protein